MGSKYRIENTYILIYVLQTPQISVAKNHNYLLSKFICQCPLEALWGLVDLDWLAHASICWPRPTLDPAWLRQLGWGSSATYVSHISPEASWYIVFMVLGCMPERSPLAFSNLQALRHSLESDCSLKFCTPRYLTGSTLVLAWNPSLRLCLQHPISQSESQGQAPGPRVGICTLSTVGEHHKDA